MNLDDFEFDIDYYSRPVEPLGEMATVVTVNKPRPVRVQVNPDSNRKGSPYFKVFPTERFNNDTRVARLHFLDSGMEYHRDEFKDWKITNKDCDDIISVLKSTHYRFSDYTVWQMTCYYWNMEYQFILPDEIDRYMNGEFDDEYKSHPSYIPSTTPIPTGWIYDPPKGKNKRK